MQYNDFKDIEPYFDHEVPEAIERILADPQLPIFLKWVNPKIDIQKAFELMGAVRTTDEFQHRVMVPFMMHVIKTTSRHFTWEGTQYIEPGKQYLFVSNHRDILLDAALLNFIFLRLNMPTSEIAFGDNLIAGPLFSELARCNRMFPIARGGSRREFFQASSLTSRYIRHALTEKGRSVWIAQRNGRTKDGDDRTEPGLLKMFSMSSDKGFVENMAELNIVPVSVSYEFEPCADRKVHETHVRRELGQYTKAPNEDLESIIQGIHDQKRDVHIAICPPITRNELEVCAQAEATAENLSRANAAYNALAALIDRRIYEGYKLFPFSLEAYNLLKAQCQEIDLGSEPDLLLHLYAAPVENKITEG